MALTCPRIINLFDDDETLSSFHSGSHAVDGWGKAWAMAAWKESSLASWCHLVERRMLEGGQGRLRSWPLHPRVCGLCWDRLAAEAVRPDKWHIL